MRRFGENGILGATVVQLPIWIGLAAFFAALLGCGGPVESQVDEDTEGHPLTGEIVEVRATEGILKVAHDDIPDFMPAMTMDFVARRGDLEIFEPGMRIRARLTRGENGEFVLKKIWPLGDSDAEKSIRKATEAQAKRQKEMGSGRYLAEGDEAPEIALYDQFGQLIDGRELRGKFVMMNFIFTRCKDAKMCPLSTSKMARMQRQAKEEGVDNLFFVSVTMDPLYDTPGVLKEYGDLYSIDGDNFRFATGPKAAVRGLLDALGVTSVEKPEGGDYIHSLATTLIGPDGKIVLRSDKSAWEVAEFLELVKG
ncbi:MAG: SCO family protein [Verrucomicrobiota bacterium]